MTTDEIERVPPPTLSEVVHCAIREFPNLDVATPTEIFAILGSVEIMLYRERGLPHPDDPFWVPPSPPTEP